MISIGKLARYKNPMLNLNGMQVEALLFFLSIGLVLSQPDNKTAQFLGIKPIAENGMCLVNVLLCFILMVE